MYHTNQYRQYRLEIKGLQSTIAEFRSRASRVVPTRRVTRAAAAARLVGTAPSTSPSSPLKSAPPVVCTAPLEVTAAPLVVAPLIVVPLVVAPAAKTSSSVCGLCGKAYAKTFGHTRHMSRAHNDVVFKCDYCQLEFKCKHNLHQHFKRQICYTIWNKIDAWNVDFLLLLLLLLFRNKICCWLFSVVIGKMVVGLIFCLLLVPLFSETYVWAEVGLFTILPFYFTLEFLHIHMRHDEEWQK